MRLSKEAAEEDGEYSKENSKYSIRSFMLQVILFAALTFWEFIVLELFFKQSVDSFEVGVIVKNTVLIGVFNMVLVALFHRMRPAFAISTIGVLFIGIANYFVILFRGYGIVFMDFYAVKTATSVAGRYTYSIDKYFVAGIVAGIASIALCFVMPAKRRAYFDKISTLLSAFGLMSCMIFVLWINTDATFFKNVSSLTWDHNVGISEYGYLLYFTANAGEASVEEPSGYSVEKVDEILSQYEEDDDTDTGSDTKSPNIIMIMDESFSDLRVLGDFTTSENVLSFYDSLDDNTIKGYVESSVYGGYTANSEFEFLTGCSKAFLPGNPYLQYIDDYLPSAISNIKSQPGYSSALAIHPYNGSGYNRNRVYPLLYFDKFLTIDDFANPLKVREYISDESDFEKIEQMYEQKDDDTSLCLFNVTMQNHNPYDYTNYEFDDPVTVTSFCASSQVNQYLSLMKMSDDALKNLVTYFEGVDEPTIILLFGDHQPHLPDSFYESVSGKNPTEFNQEDTMKKHLVPFMIWANYDIPSQYIEKTSINYLSSILLQTAGLKMSDYNRYLLALSRKLPSISATGYYDEKGGLHSTSEFTGEYAELMDEYEMVQYNYLFDKDNRLDEHYEVN